MFTKSDSKAIENGLKTAVTPTTASNEIVKSLDKGIKVLGPNQIEKKLNELTDPAKNALKDQLSKAVGEGIQQRRNENTQKQADGWIAKDIPKPTNPISIKDARGGFNSYSDFVKSQVAAGVKPSVSDYYKLEQNKVMPTPGTQIRENDQTTRTDLGINPRMPLDTNRVRYTEAEIQAETDPYKKISMIEQNKSIVSEIQSEVGRGNQMGDGTGTMIKQNQAETIATQSLPLSRQIAQYNATQAFAEQDKQRLETEKARQLTVSENEKNRNATALENSKSRAFQVETLRTQQDFTREQNRINNEFESTKLDKTLTSQEKQNELDRLLKESIAVEDAKQKQAEVDAKAAENMTAAGIPKATADKIATGKEYIENQQSVKDYRKVSPAINTGRDYTKQALDLGLKNIDTEVLYNELAKNPPKSIKHIFTNDTNAEEITLEEKKELDLYVKNASGNLSPELQKAALTSGFKELMKTSDQQALIFAFARVLDPASIVKEGEYATFGPNANGFFTKLGIKLENFTGNKKVVLTPEQTVDMISTMGTYAKGHRQNAQQIVDSQKLNLNGLYGIPQEELDAFITLDY